jgi:hypothetical protein
MVEHCSLLVFAALAGGADRRCGGGARLRQAGARIRVGASLADDISLRPLLSGVRFPERASVGTSGASRRWAWRKRQYSTYGGGIQRPAAFHCADLRAVGALRHLPYGASAVVKPTVQARVQQVFGGRGAEAGSVAAVGGRGCRSVQALQRREAPWRDQEGVCTISGEGFRALSRGSSMRSPWWVRTREYVLRL